MNVAFISLYGSQNYWLDTPSSDKDFKAVILPSLDDLVNNSQPISTTIEHKWWQIDLKDIRVFTENVCKMNPVYLETLYSPYSNIYNERMFNIIDERDKLVKEMSPLIYKWAYGQILQKVKAFDHPFPSIKDKVEKYWYDPKQLHHIARLFFLIRWLEYYWHIDFSPIWIDNMVLMWLKTNPRDLFTASAIRDNFYNEAKIIYERHKDDPMSFNAKNRVLNISKDIIKQHIICQIRQTEEKT